MIKIAVEPDEYMECHTLMRKENFPYQELGFPTVMYFDKDEELVGFLGTDIQNDLIVAGPLVLKRDKRRSFTALRLMSAYDDAMEKLGINSYIFWIDTNESGLTRGIKKYFPELTPYSVDGTKEFYVRKLGNKDELHRMRVAS